MDPVTFDLDSETEKVYEAALEAITGAGIPVLVGGGVAFRYYTGYPRSFGDLDLFCKAGDYPKILELLGKKGFGTAVQDEKWLAKASKDKARIDLIFSAPNNIQTVDDSWFMNAKKGELLGAEVAFLGVEELLWSKIYVQNADKFDGPDVYHLILKNAKKLDWQNILRRMEADWEVLLAALITFRFIFPSKRDILPRWLMTELVDRLNRQLSMPQPHDNICRGPVLSRTNYAHDVTGGGFIV